MRIAFIISSLGSGGAEKVAVNLCNTWHALGHEISIVSFEAVGADPFYPVCEEIQILRLNLLSDSSSPRQGLLSNVLRIYKLRLTLKRINPDIAVSFMTETGILSALALLGSNLPLVISERIDPRSHPIATIWQRLRKWTYPLASAVVVQTRPIRDHISSKIKINARIIPNPVKLSDYSITTRTDGPTIRPLQLTAIGRLDRQKGFDILLQAIAALNTVDVQLNLYGNGPERGALDAYIAEHDLQTRVHLPGRSRKIPEILANTDIFVHPARYEGYPNVVIEALAAGCCVLACDDTGGGTRELLGGNRHGMLVPVEDVPALTTALERLLDDSALRARYRGSAPKAVAHLDLPVIAEQWLDLFEELTHRP